MQGQGRWPGITACHKPLALAPPAAPAPPAVPPAAPTPELLEAADSVEWTEPRARAAGLRNRGNTCFLNATLQALTHTPALARMALHRLHTSGCQGVPCALCVLLRQIRNGLCESSYHSVDPDEILSHMQHFARSLTRGRQEDAHELLRLTLEALHHAGLKSVGCPTHGPRAAPSMRDRTVVERVFGGMLRSTVTCRSCGAVSQTHDTFEDLSLELQGGIQSVNDALTAFTHTERLDEANKYRCDSCKQLTAAEKRITVAKAPNVLVIHLKRFSAMGGKITRPVAFNELLSLQPHMSEADDGAQYSLYSVVVHDGYSVSCGHYYAYARDALGQWSSYNDSYVSSVSRQTVLNTPSAYILFYQRMQPPLPPLVLPPSMPPVPPLSLKRKRALLPSAAAAAKAKLLAVPDECVLALQARLRASALVSLVRDSLRLKRSRLPTDVTTAELVRVWLAEESHDNMVSNHALPEADSLAARAAGELRAQLESAKAG